jgi:V-type H+-transporting ATPase S1 subunit
MGVVWNRASLILFTVLSCTQVEAANNATGTVLTGELQMFFSRVVLKVIEEGTSPLAVRTVDLPLTQQTLAQEDKNATLTLSFGVTNSLDGKLKIETSSIKIIFIKGGYWTVASLVASAKGTFSDTPISFDGKFLSSMQIAAPRGMSFHCSRFGPLYPARNTTDKPPADKTIPTFSYSLEFLNFQIQPFMTANSTTFGTSYDCVGFFSIGILSGIFINILLMAILAWGLVMVMSVKTMDRFDDPKGKPISVGATD